MCTIKSCRPSKQSDIRPYAFSSRHLHIEDSHVLDRTIVGYFKIFKDNPQNGPCRRMHIRLQFFPFILKTHEGIRPNRCIQSKCHPPSMIYLFARTWKKTNNKTINIGDQYHHLHQKVIVPSHFLFLYLPILATHKMHLFTCLSESCVP